jgi:hypothetical protein
MSVSFAHIIVIAALVSGTQASRVKKHFFETTLEERARQAFVDADNAESMAGEALQWGNAAVSDAVAVGGDPSHGAVLLTMETTDGPTPMFTKETMPAVAPTLQCVISLSIQYFLIYTLLAVIRTANQFTGHSMLGLQKIIETAATTVTYAPMLSVLFLGVRMRAIQLSQGQTEKYQLPQPWVQQAMFICTYAVLAQVILVLIMPVFTGEMDVQCDEEGNLDTSKMQVGGMMGTVISVVRYIIMAALYGGFVTICYGAFVMKGPKEIWGEEGAPPVSPAVGCTMNLATQFFVVYLLAALVKTTVELSGPSPFLTKLGGLLTLARFTVNFAPMLCILFIGARMRALQMDPKHGNPQKWAQNCFYMCAYSVLIQTVLVIMMPFCVECECKQGSSEGDVVFEMENQTIGIIIAVVRWICLLALYGGFTAVIYSVFVIEHPTDVSLTPPISPAMQCVMNLTVQYFFIYLCLWICITAQQFMGSSPFWDSTIAIFDAARATVMFAPMLSMLFIGTRMRALQLTKATDGTIPPTAGPQGWAQDGMFLSTWAVLVQVIMAILVPILTGSKPEMDEDGNLKTPEGSSVIIAYICDGVKYICLIAMYGGAVTVMYAVYTMTPETLPPYAERGSLIPGAPVPNPPTPPTPGF